jgi:hypothetical protein
MVLPFATDIRSPGYVQYRADDDATSSAQYAGGNCVNDA